MNRIAAIEKQILDHFVNMKHNVYVATNDEEWAAATTRLGNNIEAAGETPFGWSLPFHDETSDTRQAMLLYPQRIVEITKHLDDEYFGHFLDTIEFRLNYKFAWFGENRFYDVDALLGQESPDALELLNSVQLKVLDAAT